jgi:hypothetical protein
MKNILLAIIFVFGFYGCGGGGGAPIDDTESKKIAYFLDSVVDGIEYEWENCTNISAYTFNKNGPHLTGAENGPGSFYYQNGCTVKFRIGNVYLGDIHQSNIPPADSDGKRRIYPTNILGLSTTNTADTRVDNVIRILQSLDIDSDPRNGIDINQSVRTNLYSASSLNLKRYDTVTESSLTQAVTTADANKTLVSINVARSHFDKTLQTYVNPSLDTSIPAAPYLIDKNKQNATLTQIRTFHTKKKKVILYGESGTRIFLAQNYTGDDTNLSFIDTGLVMKDDWTQELTLEFDNDSETHFHKFIMLRDASDKNSTILHLDVIKDFVPPQVQDSTIGEKVFEEQVFFRNINATDSSEIKFYQIVEEIRDVRSIDDEKFQIDGNGSVTFKEAPNFDDLDAQKDFQLVARAVDEVGNMTDVFLKVSLKNLLDNPPILKDGLTEFNTTLDENPAPNAFVADLNETLEDNLAIAPDNNLTISNFMHYTLLSHSHIFDLNLTTGRLTVKDENNSLFDFENYDGTTPHDSRIPVSFMISNAQNNEHLDQNNTPNVDYNTTATFYVKIENKLDTKPNLMTPSTTYTIPEHSLHYDIEGKYYFENFYPSFIRMMKNEVNSKFDFVDFPFLLTIEAGNDGNNFGIEGKDDRRIYLITKDYSGQDHPDGIGRLNHSHGSTLDYETKPEYNLTIRASNSFDDNSDGNYIDDNITTFTYDINVTIKIQNVLDSTPVVILKDFNSTFPESIASGQVVATIEVNGTNNDENTIDGGYIQSYIRDRHVNNENLEVYKKGDPAKDDFSFVPFALSVNASDNNGTIYTTSQLLDDKFFLEDANGSSHTYTVNVYATNTWWDGSEHKNINMPSESPIAIDFNVTNVIDHPPKLDTATQSVYILDENETLNTVLSPKPVRIANSNTTLYDEKNVTRYEIVNPNNNNRFDINTTTGDIYIKNQLDWETNTSFTIEYKAVNTWWNGVEHDSDDTRTITVNINNIIEKVPSIYVSSSVDIHENVDDGHILMYLETNSTEVDEQNVTSITLSATPSDNNFKIVDNSFDSNVKNLIVINDDAENDENTIDYEDTNTTYTLEINATNPFGSKIYTTQVNIIDDVERGVPLLVLMVGFADVNFTSTVSSVKNIITTDLYDYFYRVSYNKFNFVQAKENYGINGPSPDPAGSGTQDDGVVKISLSDVHPKDDRDVLKNITVKNALINASSSGEVDFSIFDQAPRGNGDGNISKEELQILLLVAEDENNTVLSSHEGSYSFDSNLTLNGVNVASVSDGFCVVVGEKENNETITIGRIAKMLSEKLFDFPKGDTNYKYGKFDLMGDGYQGFESGETVGSTPVHLSIFNKNEQGWKSPMLLRKGVYDPFDLYNTHDMEDFNAIRIPTDNPNIYYLVENRNKTNELEISDSKNYDNGFDGIISGFAGGLIVWKVDDSSNTIVQVDVSGNINNIYNIGSFNSDDFNLSSPTIENDTDPAGTKKFTVKIEVN